MRNERYKIGEVAKHLGLNPRTIRFYEEVGLLPSPPRTAHGYASAGHRLFTSEDLHRLEFVRQARLLDLSLAQIRALLEAAEEGCCGVARPHLKTLIRGKLPELRQRIAALQQLERHLEILLHTLPDDAPTVDRSCDGTVEQCVSLENQSLIHISPPTVRRSRRNR